MTKLTGGRTNYYVVRVEHPQRENQLAYNAECEDIIDALNMDFNEANEFKAIWRTAAARLGNGKPDHKATYDAEKRVHYAQRSLRKLKLETPVEAIPQEETKKQGYIPHNGKNLPEAASKYPTVDVVLRSGNVLFNRSPDSLSWVWDVISADLDIVSWRPGPVAYQLKKETV